MPRPHHTRRALAGAAVLVAGVSTVVVGSAGPSVVAPKTNGAATHPASRRDRPGERLLRSLLRDLPLTGLFDFPAAKAHGNAYPYGHAPNKGRYLLDPRTGEPTQRGHS